jgi:hypothetical protein
VINRTLRLLNYDPDADGFEEEEEEEVADSDDETAAIIFDERHKLRSVSSAQICRLSIGRRHIRSMTAGPPLMTRDGLPIHVPGRHALRNAFPSRHWI